MASAVDSRLAYARLSAAATASRLPTANRGSNNSYTTSWDTTPRGEDSIAELCRREGIAESLCYSWSKEFLEAGKKRLSGDTARQASSGEVKDLCREMHDLKEVLAEQVLENRLLKKSMTGAGGDSE